jgi:hypothetical protein
MTSAIEVVQMPQSLPHTAHIVKLLLGIELSGVPVREYPPLDNC